MVPDPQSGLEHAQWNIPPPSPGSGFKTTSKLPGQSTPPEFIQGSSYPVPKRASEICAKPSATRSSVMGSLNHIPRTPFNEKTTGAIPKKVTKDVVRAHNPHNASIPPTAAIIQAAAEKSMQVRDKPIPRTSQKSLPRLYVPDSSSMSKKRPLSISSKSRTAKRLKTQPEAATSSQSHASNSKARSKSCSTETSTSSRRMILDYVEVEPYEQVRQRQIKAAAGANARVIEALDLRKGQQRLQSDHEEEEDYDQWETPLESPEARRFTSQLQKGADIGGSPSLNLRS